MAMNKKLTEDEIIAIQYRHAMYRETIPELAECFEVSERSIKAALKKAAPFSAKEAAE